MSSDTKVDAKHVVYFIEMWCILLKFLFEKTFVGTVMTEQ